MDTAPDDGDAGEPVAGGAGADGERTPPPPMTALRRRLLIVGMVLGGLLVAVPFVISAVSIRIASRGVPEGLRGATHLIERREEVAVAYGSVSFMALLAPLGVLLFVLCGAPFVNERQRRVEAERAARRAGRDGGAP